MTIGPAPQQSRVEQITDAVLNIPTLINEMVTYVVTEGHGVRLAGSVAELIRRFGTDAHNVVAAPENLVSSFSESLGSPIVDFIFRESLGLDFDKANNDARRVFNTISRMVGFCILLTYQISAIGFIGKLLGANRFAEHQLKALQELPHEMGISWAIGSTAADIFTYVIDGPLREFINTQMHPTRIEWPQVRTLLKQHHLTEAQFFERMNNLGFRPEDANLILKAMDARLSVSELASLYVQGMMNREQVTSYLVDLGYGTNDANMLATLYLDRSETQAGALYRSVVERAFREYHISEEQFRATLERIHVPPQSIDVEVQAVRLDQQIGAMSLTVSDVKVLWEDGSMAPEQARQELHGLGYNDTDISYLFTLWRDEANAKSKKVPYTRVLSYLVSGVLTRNEAYARLVGDGFRAEDAQLLVEHPETKTKTQAKVADENDVLTAYEDGLLTVDEAMRKLQALGKNQDDINLDIRISNHRIQTKNKKKQGPKVLEKGDLKAAMRYNQLTELQTMRALEEMGYTANDAALLTTVWIFENKMAGENVPHPPGQ